LLSRRPDDAAVTAAAAAGSETEPPMRGLAGATREADVALRALQRWATERGRDALAAHAGRCAALSPVGRWRSLAGPTGEANLYAMVPREAVLCLADDDDLLLQLAAVLAVGSHALWPAAAHALWQRLPDEARDRVALVDDWRHDAIAFDAVLHHGDAASLLSACADVAARPGPIVGVTAMTSGGSDIPIERLVVERSLSINTAAAGGNASLMTMG
jgi:RHH-type proline utilization regulon transcriptional repressor/proline dehydrogenase/delta 1-pyrroline-5-carboxylate dehydrogenase